MRLSPLVDPNKGRIVDVDEIKTVRRRGRPAGAAVAGGKSCCYVLGPPTADADQFEGTRHVTHLAMQERPGARLDANLLAKAPDLERIECAQRRPRLAQPITKRCEIVMPDETLGCFLHRLGVKRRGDTPHPAAVQRCRRPPVQNAVEIGALNRRQSGIEMRWRRIDGEHADRSVPQVMVQRPAYDIGRRLSR